MRSKYGRKRRYFINSDNVCTMRCVRRRSASLRQLRNKDRTLIDSNRSWRKLNPSPLKRSERNTSWDVKSKKADMQ